MSTETAGSCGNEVAPRYVDEVALRELYQRMIDNWQDATTYAECFAQDADYIIANGKLEHGWKEIADNHKLIFSAWARNSHLEGRIHRLRFLTRDVAVITAYGHIVYDDHRSSDNNKRTIYTLIAQRIDDAWIFVGYQNTPLGGH
jgi:uncharacterized protein (TIGR02246 family)